MFFSYVSRRKVQELKNLYEQLLRMHDLRDRYPQAWLALNARIGDLNDELGLTTTHFHHKHRHH